MAKVVGKVSHYFDKIGVAALTLSGTLKVGDMVKIAGGEREVKQTVSSMQIEHKPVQKAGKGDDVAIKVDQPVKEGDQVSVG